MTFPSEPIPKHDVATNQLIERHAAEYEVLVERVRHEEARSQLLHVISGLTRTINSLYRQNPNGVDAVALSETANTLARKNDALVKLLAAHHAVGAMDGAKVGDTCPVCRTGPIE